MTQLRPVRWLRDHPAAADALLAAVLAVISASCSTSPCASADYHDPRCRACCSCWGPPCRSPGDAEPRAPCWSWSWPARSWSRLQRLIGTGWLGLLVAAYTRGHAARRAECCGGSAVSALLACARLRRLGRGPRRRSMAGDGVDHRAVRRGDRAGRQHAPPPRARRRAGRACRTRRARARTAGHQHVQRRAHAHRPRAARRGRPQREPDGHPGRRPPAGSWPATRSRPISVLETVEDTGREAMSEMRRMLGVLRATQRRRAVDVARPAAVAHVARRPGVGQPPTCPCRCTPRATSAACRRASS